jgi:hypothetical protein
VGDSAQQGAALLLGWRPCFSIPEALAAGAVGGVLGGWWAETRGATTGGASIPEWGFKGGSADSWGRPETLADHFVRHGPDFGAATEEDYANMASAFLRRSQAEGLPTNVDANGIIRAYEPSTNTFGSYNPNGTTRTLFKPSGADYFARQPGAPPVVLGGHHELRLPCLWLP